MRNNDASLSVFLFARALTRAIQRKGKMALFEEK